MKEVKLIIPDNWKDITIGTYQKYVKIQEGKGTDKTKVVKSLALLCNTSPFIVKKMAYKDLFQTIKLDFLQSYVSHFSCFPVSLHIPDKFR